MVDIDVKEVTSVGKTEKINVFLQSEKGKAEKQRKQHEKGINIQIHVMFNKTEITVVLTLKS